MQRVVVVVIALALSSHSVRAEEAQEPAVKLAKGPLSGALGDIATIKVPEGYRFAGKSQMAMVNKLTGNLDNPDDIGAIFGEGWVVFFNWQDIGYVKDDDKGALDADKLMESFKDREEPANDARREQGLEPMFIVGWHTRPHYDTRTNNLTWAIAQEIGEKREDKNLNHEVRLLGRRGVVSATLAAGPERLDSAIKELDGLLAGFTFNSGSTYGEYRQGDKLATYGLAGLVLGGGAVLAAKSGLLAKLGKFIKVIVLGVAALVGGIVKMFSGKKDEPKT
ncbi:MAG: DUF2167 domain-containing protein [Deltaproteobacteria bacterium]|nr:DUF2167 domain-containing protein [Deltaproteobacteria bacterium]